MILPKPRGYADVSDNSSSGGLKSGAARLAKATILFLIAIASLLAASRYLIVPLVIYCFPQSATSFLDSGVLGPYPLRTYVSTDLTSPRASVVRSEPSCSDGLVLLSVGGQSVPGSGPMILDMAGNLVWSAPGQYGEDSANTKIQRYRGEDYLTFWAGEKLQESGRGSYYMLDSSYDVIHTISAVGEGLDGDLHEFKITDDGTALITVYDRMWADLSATNLELPAGQMIVDGILQEINLATGELLFEWRASDHLSHSALQTSHGGIVADESFDYFHMNSIEKDSSGHYLISLRHQHALVYVDGRTGDIVWTLSREAGDFEDLSQGEATSFQWQHDARWVSEEEGIISLFDNGIARHHPDSAYSRGIVVQLDFRNWTAKLLRDYKSLNHIGSASQGNVQTLQQPQSEEHIFIGWGASAAFSEFDLHGDLLCEAHFGAEQLFYFERVKSYRAFKTLEWKATPASWDPQAQTSGNRMYVSWNGATEVAYWSLQVWGNLTDTMPDERDADESFKEIELVEKGTGFESTFLLPDDDAAKYRIAALDAQGNVLRYSNEVLRKRSYTMTWILPVCVVAALLLVACYLSYSLNGWTCSQRKERSEKIEYHALEQQQPA